MEKPTQAAKQDAKKRSWLTVLIVTVVLLVVALLILSFILVRAVYRCGNELGADQGGTSTCQKLFGT